MLRALICPSCLRLRSQSHKIFAFALPACSLSSLCWSVPYSRCFPHSKNIQLQKHWRRRSLWSQSSGESDRQLIKPEQSSKEVAEEEEKGVSEDKKTEEIDFTKGLYQFFHKKSEWGRTEVRCGREWTENELRLKSNQDLHKLWYVLLKERNVLMTLKYACNKSNEYYPSPERFDRIQMSMKNLESVVRERNRAHLELETGKTGERPTKRVTEFTGFTVEKPMEEHVMPHFMNPNKKREYERPYVEDEAYLFQKYWKEKQHMKKRDDTDDWKRREGLHKHVYKY